MGRARDISKVFSTGTALATDTEVSGSYLTQSSASTVYQTKSATGLTLISPSTIANTSGTASIGTNGTVTFSGVSSISLNNVFSSTYKTYRIVFNSDTTQACHIQIRLRSTTDNTTSNYFSGYWYTNLVSGATGIDVAGSAQSSMTRAGYTNDAASLVMFYDIFNPVESKKTGISAIQSRNDAVVTNVGGLFNLTNSFDGITFFPSGGTMSGVVSVYGYNQ
jgi:hypothetical protein